MNKREIKKKEKHMDLGYDLGFVTTPSYKVLKEIKRRYHMYCIQNPHTDKDNLVYVNGQWI